MGDLTDRYIETSRWRIEDAAGTDRDRPRSPGHQKLRFGDYETEEHRTDDQ